MGWSSTLKMEEADSSNILEPVNHTTWHHMLAKCNSQLTVICKRIFVLLLDKPNEYLQRGMDVKKKSMDME